MFRCSVMLLLLIATASAEPLEEWKPYAAAGLFPKGSVLWVAPDMEKEPINAYMARLLEATRASDAKAMATLGRFFYIRGDMPRAGEWLGKAARAGHAGAQLDYGVLRLRGVNEPPDPIEAYAWLWLATWGDAPGAEDALRRFAQNLSIGQIVAGMKLVSALQPAAPPR